MNWHIGIWINKVLLYCNTILLALRAHYTKHRNNISFVSNSSDLEIHFCEISIRTFYLLYLMVERSLFATELV